MELKGNKGEWSEIYVFLRLLDSGRLVVADDKLNAVPNEFYKILEIIRKETESTNNYIREDDSITICVTNDKTGKKETFKYKVSEFAQKADQLLQLIKDAKGRSFQLPLITSFLHELRISSVKDVNHNRDITIMIEDFHTKMTQTLGFSIKSYLGKNSTLFNPGPGTNFIFKVALPNNEEIDCDAFNRETYSLPGKIGARLNSLITDYKATVTFREVQSKCLDQNLKAIDGDMPLILANMLLIKYIYGISDIKKCTEQLTKKNPLDFQIQTHGNIYEYKVKRFLQDCAQGMTPEKPWLGIYDATGGQIIVKDNGDVVCYHIYELNRFRSFLFNSTKLEYASTGEDSSNPGHESHDPSSKKYYYGWLYKENNQYYIKINLQVRSK